MVDGPFAGTPLRNADASGRLDADHGSNAAAGVHGFIRAPSADCPDPHFEGSIGGKKITASECLRVTSNLYAQRFLTEMAAAIDAEQQLEKRPQNASDYLLKQAHRHLNDAFDELAKAVPAQKIDEGSFATLQEEFIDVRKLDQEADKDLDKGDDAAGRKKLAKALRLKHHIVDAAPSSVNLEQPPVLSPLEANFNAGLSETTYTVAVTQIDYEPRPLTYHWSLFEHNDPTCINFQPNTPTEEQAVWHHANSDGCNHALEGTNGHVGTVVVFVTDARFICAATYDGTNTGTGPRPGPCQRLY